MIHIRKSTLADVDAIMAVYDSAKVYMRSYGNMTQWTNGYPARSLVESDIHYGNSYVGTDADGRIVMTFAFILGDDPTYAVIENGRWLDSNPYGTIHRLASDGTCGGVLRTCVDFCFTITDNIRVDTHADNRPMLCGLAGLGFTRCGIIYCADGTPRTAFQKHFIN